MGSKYKKTFKVVLEVKTEDKDATIKDVIRDFKSYANSVHDYKVTVEDVTSEPEKLDPQEELELAVRLKNNLSEEDWDSTPESVREVLIAGYRAAQPQPEAASPDPGVAAPATV